MAQGEFTKQEAQATIEAVDEMFSKGISKNRRGEFLGHLNDVLLFLQAAKKAAPEAKGGAK
jgi:hypothetical protein